MLVIDKAVQEGHHLLFASELESITLPDGTTRPLGPQRAMPSPILWTYAYLEAESVRSFCSSNISARHLS
jgi:hypothetical protein